MCNCFKFVDVCVSHNWSTLTHPFSLFPSKLLLPLWRHATLTLKKSADLWLFYAFVSVPSPVFYGRLLEYEAEEAFLPSERQGWGSIFSETITLFCPSFPFILLLPSGLHISVFYSQAGLPQVSFYLWWVASPLQAKLECWNEVMFLQMVCFGRLVMELSLSFVPALLRALFSSLWCTQPYVPLSFLGSDVLMVVGFERCHCVVRRSCSVLGFWEDCHLNLLLIDTLLSLKTLYQFLTQFIFEVQNFLTTKLLILRYWAFQKWYKKALQVKQEQLIGSSVHAVDRQKP